MPADSSGADADVPPTDAPPPDAPPPDEAGDAVPDLARAYSELQGLLLDGPDLIGFLHQVAALATAVVLPAGSCGITMRRGGDVATIATSDDLAAHVDEIQYGVGDGPCLEALRTGVPTRVDDLATDDRWGDYRAHAIAYGVRSSVSFPLTVNDETLGALNLYGREPRSFGPTEFDRAEAFARQTAVTLAIALRSLDRTVMEVQLRQALATRAVIDQALGILMGQRRIGSRQAFDVLRQASQTRNRPLRVIAAELVVATTGGPPDPPRPFAEPR